MPNLLSGLLKKIFLTLFLCVLAGHATFVQAVIKDSDLDGLSDQAEVDLYRTDPTLLDTDTDTISDGQEVIDGTNPLDQTSSRLADFEVEKEVLMAKTNSLPWIIGRASGIFAFFILSIVVVNGLLISTRQVFRVLPPPLNYNMHHFLSYLAIVTVLGHAASFFFDPFFRLTIGEAILPFSLERPFASALGVDLTWAIGFGTLALYGLIALGVSSFFKAKISLRSWRFIHYGSFATYLLFLIHGIVSGTDTRNWWMITLYGVSGVLVGILIIIRIVTALRDKKKLSSPTIPPTQSDMPVNHQPPSPIS